LVKSLIYVPLILQNKPIGVLGVTNQVKDSSFDSNDTRALSALGGYATIAINNANMFHGMARERVVLSEVVEQIEDAVIVVDEDFRLLVLNAAARGLFAMPEGNAIGRPIMDLSTSRSGADGDRAECPERERRIEQDSAGPYRARVRSSRWQPLRHPAPRLLSVVSD
jgi:transcriptional regulator with PAS, ATPase and Fis domain